MAAVDDLDRVLERCQQALREFVKRNPEPSNPEPSGGQLPQVKPLRRWCSLARQKEGVEQMMRPHLHEWEC